MGSDMPFDAQRYKSPGTKGVTDRVGAGAFEQQIIRNLRLIRHHLSGLGVSQAKWARGAMMQPSYLCTILRGGQTNLTIATLDRLLDAAWVMSRSRLEMHPRLTLDGVPVVRDAEYWVDEEGEWVNPGG